MIQYAITKDTTYLKTHATHRVGQGQDFWENCRPKTGFLGENDTIDEKFVPLQAEPETLIVGSYNPFTAAWG